MALRIIGGRFGGRRLTVSDRSGVRPTGNRIRETLFNWLGDAVIGARVLDLFAGTGALGIEALSRGAASAVFVDSAGAQVRALRDNLATLGVANAEIVRRDARRFLAASARPFDIVFLDPPFRSAIIEPACAQLDSEGWLAPGACVYLEYDLHGGRPALPTTWEVVRDRQAGGVGFALARRNEGNAGS